MMYSNRKRLSRCGFSLIELMVVIVIIGILGTAAVFIYMGAVGDSKTARAKAEIAGLKDAIATYKLKNNNELPSGLEELKSLSKDFNLDDPWKRPYQYDNRGDGFRITSQGESQSSTDDDVWYDSDEGWSKDPEKK